MNKTTKKKSKEIRAKFTFGLKRLTAWGYFCYIELFLITVKHTQSIDQVPIFAVSKEKSCKRAVLKCF